MKEHAKTTHKSETDRHLMIDMKMKKWVRLEENHKVLINTGLHQIGGVNNFSPIQQTKLATLSIWCMIPGDYDL